jgi:hypothetical protein
VTERQERSAVRSSHQDNRPGHQHFQKALVISRLTQGVRSLFTAAVKSLYDDARTRFGLRGAAGIRTSSWPGELEIATSDLDGLWLSFTSRRRPLLAESLVPSPPGLSAPLSEGPSDQRQLRFFDSCVSATRRGVEKSVAGLRKTSPHLR